MPRAAMKSSWPSTGSTSSEFSGTVATVAHPSSSSRPTVACCHCGTPVPDSRGAGQVFCCAGCEAAYALVRGFGLDGYYERRVIDPRQRPLIPETDPVAIEFCSYVRDEGDGVLALNLMVEGLHCAACVWLIETVLARQSGVVTARVNLTTRRLTLRWRHDETEPDVLIAVIARLGYRLVPYDPEQVGREGDKREKELLRSMAVAGFAAGNVMLLSISVWAGHAEGMGPATRGLLHWMSALIALPAIAYAGVPFFRSALGVLRVGHVNMDVPISLAVILATAMSLHETAIGAEHVYFDSAVALLFFLLVGRYLDHHARGRARSAAEHLLALSATAVTLIDAEGHKQVLAPAHVKPGMRAFAAAGDRIPVDGRVVDGVSDVDTSLIDGETVPTTVRPGTMVFAGTHNLSAPLIVEIAAVGEDTLLAEIARQVETAEQGKSRYVAIADRLARLYAPVVHGAAMAAFLGWWLLADVTWQSALLIAISVLIITCPCALALAVPAVQVVASGRLLRQGILLTSATALERLATIDTIVFDKTGTLTEGRPELETTAQVSREGLSLAAALGHASRHPMARAVVRAAESFGLDVTPASGVREVAGCGLVREDAGGVVRLGNRAFVGVAEDQAITGPELWLARPDNKPIRFVFADPLRSDAGMVINTLKTSGYRLAVLSGDRASTVATVTEKVGVEDWLATCSPADKCERLRELAAKGQKVLMVGDGLNDAPALATAHASMSPSSAVDLSRTVADVIFQGARLAPVVESLETARRASRLVRQNFVLAFLYNGITVPLAMAGLVTPLIAAISMSASSIVVIINALRLNRGSPWTSSSS